MNCLFCDKIIDTYCLECSASFFKANGEIYLYQHFFDNEKGSFIAEFQPPSNQLTIFERYADGDQMSYKRVFDVKFERLLNPQEIEAKFKSLLIFT